MKIEIDENDYLASALKRNPQAKARYDFLIYKSIMGEIAGLPCKNGGCSNKFNVMTIYTHPNFKYAMIVIASLLFAVGLLPDDAIKSLKQWIL